MRKYLVAGVIVASMFSVAAVPVSAQAVVAIPAACVGDAVDPVACLAAIAALPPAQQAAVFAALPESLQVEIASVEGFDELGLAAGDDDTDVVTFDTPAAVGGGGDDTPRVSPN